MFLYLSDLSPCEVVVFGGIMDSSLAWSTAVQIQYLPKTNPDMLFDVGIAIEKIAFTETDVGVNHSVVVIMKVIGFTVYRLFQMSLFCPAGAGCSRKRQTWKPDSSEFDCS
jgi:hypothetical protein